MGTITRLNQWLVKREVSAKSHEMIHEIPHGLLDGFDPDHRQHRAAASLQGHLEIEPISETLGLVAQQ